MLFNSILCVHLVVLRTVVGNHYYIALNLSSVDGPTMIFYSLAPNVFVKRNILIELGHTWVGMI